MLKKNATILFLLISNYTLAQNFINGDFEINTAGIDQINLSNSAFNSFISNCNAFGTNGNMDIITSTTYSGGPYSGDWYIGLTGGGTDMIALDLTTPLINGNSYTISFYDKKAVGYIALPIEVGLSTTNNSFGILIHTSSNFPVDSTWTQRTFTFIAPSTGQFITVRQQGPISTSNWVNIDKFSFDCPINLNLGNDTTICQGQSVMLSGGSATSYLWSNGSTSSTINASSPGIYWVQSSNGQCSMTDSITISINQSPYLGKDTTICQGQTVTLNGGPADSYLWSDGSITSSINAATSGTFWLQATHGQCLTTDSINIAINQYPDPNLGNDTTICQGQTITLSGGLATSYLWSNGSTASFIKVSSSGVYWVQTTNGLCGNSDTLLISTCEIGVEFPNVFTPNGDGINDDFIPKKYNGVLKANLTIYNRWGKKLFYTDNPIAWNGYHKGNICSDGTYFWIVQYTTITNESKSIKGFLTLIK
jgi:gliding motility-associated-like protein